MNLQKVKNHNLPISSINSMGSKGSKDSKSSVNTILFDLDGTLLPMDQEAFMEIYFRELSGRCLPLGYEPKALIDAVWKGTGAMVKNDGSMKNKDRFWQVFASIMGEQAYEHIPVFDDFYTKEFHKVMESTAPSPLADACVKLAREKGYTAALATNPLFPKAGTWARVGWAGMNPEDFSLITTYENASYCKPNPAYYSEILETLGKTPQECLMVGNDVSEDMVAADMGMEFFLADTCLLNPKNRELTGVRRGSLEDLLAYLKGLPDLK